MEKIQSLTMKPMKFMKKSSADAGLAAAFGGTTSEEDQERESPSIPGLSRA